MCNFNIDPDTEYKLLKQSLEQFRMDLIRFREVMHLISEETMLRLAAEIVAIKEGLIEGLEKEILDINKSK